MAAAMDNGSGRHAYNKTISGHHMAPAWERLKQLIGAEPKTSCVPEIWKFEKVKAIVMEAGTLISASEAERRVLLLENPGLPGQSRVTQTLLAGLQLIMPGEVAVGHRHSASAIRFVLDGNGAYTAVEGERTFMSPGDFVLTPNWTAHDHGNDAGQPVIWLDVLDVHMVNYFSAMFSEYLDTDVQCVDPRRIDSFALFGSGVLPECATCASQHSPIVNYSYSRIRPLLGELQQRGHIDKRHGARVRYANPLTGGWTMPTLGAQLDLLPRGFSGRDYRATDGVLFVCVEGAGMTRTASRELDWTRGDVFVVPPWQSYRHEAHDESVLFSISDRPAQEALGIWREMT